MSNTVSNSQAIDRCIRKLDALNAELPIIGPSQKFGLKEEIKETEEHLEKLKAGAVPVESKIGDAQDLVERELGQGKLAAQASELFRIETFDCPDNGITYPWNADDLARHRRGLAAGTLFISSARDEILRAAAQAVLEGDEFREHEKLSVSLSSDDNLELTALLNQIDRLKADAERNPKGHRVIFILQVTRFLLPQLSGASQRLPNLPGRGIHLLFLIPREELEDREQTHWHRGLDHWGVDDLRLLLRVKKYRGDTSDEDLSELAAKLKHHAGKARGTRDEVEMIATFTQCLQEGGVEAVRQAMAEGRLGGRVTPAEVTAARSRWAKAGPIERAALFLAVSFPGLTWEAFEYLIPALLEDKKETINQTIPTAATEEKPNPLPRTESVQVPAMTHWRECSYILLEASGLCCAEGPGADLVQFIEPKHEASLREALVFQANISRDFYDALHAHGSYFDPNTPASTVSALASATRRLVSRAAQSYNEHWLYRRVCDIQHWVGRTKTEEARNIQSGSLEQLFRSLIRAEENGRNLETFFLNRLCDLCSELLSDSTTVPTVRRFIHLLTQDPQFSRYHLLQIVRRLRGHDAFEYLPQLKYLLNSRDREIYKGVIQLLFSEANESRRFCQTFTTLVEWLPPTGETVQQPFQKWVLAFLPLWFLSTVQRHQSTWRRGSTRSGELPLFIEGAGLPPLAERLETVSRLLCHLQFPEATLWALNRLESEDAVPVGEDSGDDEEVLSVDKVDYLLAEMLEQWHHFLGASEAMPQLAVLLRAGLPRLRLQRVREFLRLKAGHHQARRGNASAAGRAIIDQYVSQARALEKLLYSPSAAGEAT